MGLLRAGVVSVVLLGAPGFARAQCTVGQDDCFAGCSRWSHVPRTAEALESAFGCTGHPCFLTDSTRQIDTPAPDNPFDQGRACATPTERARCFVQAPLGHYADLTPALEIEGWSAYQADGTANLGGAIKPLVASALYIPEAIQANRFCHGDSQSECEGDSESIGASGPETTAGEPALACRWIELPEETISASHAIFTGSNDQNGVDAGVRGSIAFEQRSVPRLCHSGTVNGGRGGREVSVMAPLVAPDDVSCLANMLDSTGVTVTTMIHVDLEGLPRSRLGTSDPGGFGWHAHDFPYRQDEQCSSARVGGHYAPFGRSHVDCSSQIQRDTSQCANDQQLCSRPVDTVSAEQLGQTCETGDFSGKYGKLWPEFSGPAVPTGSVDVWIDEGQHGVPLSGPHSIVGRSIALHAGDDGGTFVCATVGAPRPSWSTTLQFETVNTAALTRTIEGSIVLTQALEDSSGETSMLVNLRNAGSVETVHHLVINEDRCPFNPMESRRTPYDNELTAGPLPTRGGPPPSGLVERKRVDGMLTQGSAELAVACGEPLADGAVSYPYSQCILENEFAMPPFTIASGTTSSGVPTAFATLTGIPLSGPDSITDGMSMTVYAVTQPARCEPTTGNEIRQNECHAVDLDRDRAAAEAACAAIDVCEYTPMVLEPAACANFDPEPTCDYETYENVEEAVDGENVNDVVTAKFVLQIPWELFKPGFSTITAEDCSNRYSAESCRQRTIDVMESAIKREIAEFINCEDIPIDPLVYSDEYGNALTPEEFRRQGSSLTGRWSSRCEGNGLAQAQEARISNVVVDSVETVFPELYPDNPPIFNDFTAVSLDIASDGNEDSLTAAEIVAFLEGWIVQQNELLGDQRFNTNHGTSRTFAPMGHTFPSGTGSGAPLGQPLPWNWTWANVNPHGCTGCDRCLSGSDTDSSSLSTAPACVGVQPGHGQQRPGCTCFTVPNDPNCACSGTGSYIDGGRPSPLLRHFDASVGIVVPGGGLYELHEESSCIFGAMVPGRIERCCCGCPSFRHLEDAQAFCAEHKDSCGGVSRIGCAYYPRAAQYILLRDVVTYSEPYGTQPTGVISQVRRQDITVPVVALQGQRSTEQGSVLWVEFMEGWAPQYAASTKQFEISHSIISDSLQHGADYPFEDETSSVLLSCDIGNVGCTDTCNTAADGVCSDGSTAASIECAYNTDCSDCGPNLPLPECTNTCTNAEGGELVNDGICDEDEGSVTCPIGSDCNDCGNVRICRENNRLANSPTICSGPASSICTYQCDPGYDIGGQHTCYPDGRYRGGGCAPKDTLPSNMQPFVDDSEETMVCEGRTGDTCEYTCLPGYDAEGAHVAGPDGFYRGGTCVLREISTRTIFAMLCFAGVLLLGYLAFFSQRLQHQREAVAKALGTYYDDLHIRDHLAHKKEEREVAFDAEKGTDAAANQETSPLQQSASTAAVEGQSQPEPEPGGSSS